MAADSGSAPFRFEIVKAYPPRGLLRQHRVAKATAFTCGRCEADKISKLITILDDSWEVLLCNGCYGWLLSVWKIKAGALHDAERDVALLRLLREQVAGAELDRVRSVLGDLDDRLCRLSPDALTMLATAEVVVEGFESRTVTDLDWSAAVIGLCKAVELEVVGMLAVPLRERTADADLSSDNVDPDFRSMAQFCQGHKNITMGQVAHFIGVLAKSPGSTGKLAQAMRSLSSRWPHADWIFAPTGLVNDLQKLARCYRNPAAHTGVLSRSDYLACLNLVRGGGGILVRLVDGVAPVKK